MKLIAFMQKLTQWSLKLIYLNFLWLGFTIIGLFGIVGFFPALASVFAVADRLREDPENGKSMRKEFFEHYKRIFVRSNLVGYGMTAAAFVLYMDMHLLLRMDTALSYVLLPFLATVAIIFACAAVVIFPFLLDGQRSITQCFKQAFVFGTASLVSVFPIVLVVFVLFLLTINVPFLWLMGASLPCLLITVMLQKPLSKMPLYQNEESAA